MATFQSVKLWSEKCLREVQRDSDTTEQNRTQTDKGWEQKWELLNKLYTKKWSEQHFVDDFG